MANAYVGFGCFSVFQSDLWLYAAHSEGLGKSGEVTLLTTRKQTIAGKKKEVKYFFFCDWHPKVLKNEQGYFFWKAGVRFLLMFKWHFGETLKVSGWSSISWMRFTALLGLGCIQKPLSQWEGFQLIWQDFRSDCAAQMLQTKHL